MNVNKIKYYITGVGIDYAIYGLKYKFYDTTNDYARLKYGKELFLKKKLKKIIKKYKSKTNKNIRLYDVNKRHLNYFPIWFCWFQGLENAPEIVKCCYNSLLKNIKKSNNIKINIITMDNIENYIEIPKLIKKKFQDGKIPMALYSDFIRIALLSKYGGFWIDSTVLVTSDISDLCTNYNYYTKKSDMVELHFGNYLLQGRFAIHLLKIDNNELLINFLYDSLLYYYKKFNAPVDYYLTNLLVDIAYKEFPEVKKMMDDLETNDHGLESKLNEKLNEKFDKNLYELYVNNMPFQKLSHKGQYQCKVNDELTFYGYIKNKYLQGEKNE